MAKMADLLRLVGLTANPTAHEEGTLWYRKDLGQLHQSDGSTPFQVGDRTHPYIRTTSWHNLPAQGGATTLAVSLNTAYALPIVPGRFCTITDMAINVTVIGLGNVRGGVYNADQNSGLPTTLVADFGTIGTGLLGTKTWTGLSVALKPQLYYVVMVQQGIVATYSARAGWDPIISEDTGTGPVFGQDRNAYIQSGITGALPASFGAPAGTAIAPSVFLKLT